MNSPSLKLLEKLYGQQHHFDTAHIAPVLHKAASLTDWRDPLRKELRKALSTSLLGRAIGVIYRPETERFSHYFESVLGEQFDAMIWIEQTRPVTALPLPKSQQLEAEDETYPFGV